MRETIDTDSGIKVDVEKRLFEGSMEVVLRINEKKNCVLHWGFLDYNSAQWQVPPENLWPPRTSAFRDMAVQSQFLQQDGHSVVTITLDRPVPFPIIIFVLYFPDERRWDNNRGKNYRIGLPDHKTVAAHSKGNDMLDPSGVAHEIIEKEMSRNSWTLMHRFNLCFDLLDKVLSPNVDGLALIFVWLRFSYMRQLVWQRNYNTKPRELGHSMDRLTVKLAGRYSNVPEERSMIRLIMTTLGPGSDAQRVRDEVLNIMHRYHIKEVSGHFMEEWHQKLHNNATPDDIVICRALIEFYKGNGDLTRFYRSLEEGGVTAERLQSYERPIRSHPDFVANLKDALIRDLESFLGVLKEVYAGTDLGIAIHRARHLFDEQMHALMDYLWHTRSNLEIAVSDLTTRITESRRRAGLQLTGHPNNVRDMLFLDIALEDLLRQNIEQRLGTHMGEETLIALVAAGLENLCMSSGDEELWLCLSQLQKARSALPRQGLGLLQLKAALDRLDRVLGSQTDHLYKLLQPKAEFLGTSFEAAPWSIALFSQDVLRGRPAFALSLLLKELDQIIRKSAHLGNWQLVSRGDAVGELRSIDSLKSIEGQIFPRPVIVIADEVGGDEEIPGGVRAIITPTVVDILSHIGIRARNSGILFATCYDAERLGQLKALSGTFRASATPSGDVIFEERSAGTPVNELSRLPFAKILSHPAFSSYVVKASDFNEQRVGGKSNNLAKLVGRLHDWVHLPSSVAVPFGVFEEVLADAKNMAVAQLYRELSETIDEERDNWKQLDELRNAILSLTVPAALLSLLQSAMDDSGLQRDSDWEQVWTCIKQVWASKWNRRAYLSRREHGMPHDALLMSVLIQNVVEAEYSFVVHTVNPLNGSRDEIYAEIVIGLGETLVGNYPGKALSFTCHKQSKETRILSFPSKSVGLFGGGLIFRSDSNGEDLMGYAGAGLYESYMLPPSHRRTLDYSADILMNDDAFREDLLARVALIGTAIEGVTGCPQDIEGAYADGKYWVVQTRPQVGLDRI